LTNEQFRTSFGTEEACRRWFFRARWPNGFKCPRCYAPGGGHGTNARRVIVCRKCRSQTSLTAGTLLHRTRKPLRTWFQAAFLIVQRGVNARTLQRELGLTYKVAWAWGHKLRSVLKAHVIPENPGPKEALKLQASRTSAPSGWLRSPDPHRKEPCGCTKLTRRDWNVPDDLADEKEAAKTERNRLRGIEAEERLVPEDYPPTGSPWIAWDLLATFGGSLSEKHLLAYLDEYAFRQNRKERPVAEGFATLARAIAGAEPRTCREVVARPAPQGYPVSIFRITPYPKRARPA
jgi:transposase-like protein